MPLTLLGSVKSFGRRSLLRMLEGVPDASRRVLDLWFDLQASAPTPEAALHAYLDGRFPLTDPASGRIFWTTEDPRGVIPIREYRVSKNLKRLLRQDRFRVSIDRCFDEVARACADRDRTWITEQIVALYCGLHDKGFGHSFEVWEEGELVGGYFGVSLGSYFVGVSQFNRARDAGKVAFLHSAHTLREHGFLLHDVQQPTPHLEQFGCIGMPREEFRRQLARAIAAPCAFDWGSEKELRETSEISDDAAAPAAPSSAGTAPGA